ncbi:OmpA family protein [Oceanihabitans sp. 2_MG-2023]|uniref:OmpA family protein n=1 Tax=Oceanihabitans sp. 2_MG-2023 TaxID=3062661 RepID=UPI0026E16C11|nr:OmpA family protein [Oceanihabitans sp. 2_MG-2023]MDO6595742.1 OmpA family protein [Oceanihabitans sp. 2_MG-2023]
MSKKTSYLLGILLTIIIGTLLYWWLCCSCCNKESCKNKKVTESTIVAKPNVSKTTLNSFSIKDGNYAINSNDNFNFKDSNFKILEPVSEDLKNSVVQLKTYFNENPSKRVSITGYYTNGETNNSAYPNLGLARANAVKNYFVSQGISSKIIDTQGELKDSMVADENKVFFGPVDYKISAKEEGDTSAEDALKADCASLKANPLVLYFNTGEAQINLTLEQRKKIAAISRCVDKLGVKVQVVGHTDNTGVAAKNITLGQNRANFAKDYLIQNGILSTNIEALSQGPNEPIADNATEEGRAKNRRTVVTIN